MNRKRNGHSRKGFASMSKAKKSLITRMGGLACVKKMGKKHMARIGAIGGRNKRLNAA